MLSNFPRRGKKSARNPAARKSFRLLLSTVLAVAAAHPLAAQIQARSLVHNGYNRPYLIFLPVHLPPHPAIVFMLGGIRSTAESESQNFGWTDIANRNGFIVVFPTPVRTNPGLPRDRKKNITFWEMRGARTHLLASGAIPVDDDGYLMAVLQDVLHRDHPDRRRIFFVGFSSGSGMVQLFAARHSKYVSGIVAVATPLMEPPAKLARPVPVLYIHGDDDEKFAGFETHSPHFATTPHGNWVTWGYLDSCQVQTAAKTDWGVRLSWRGCKNQVPVIADFVAHLGHEWPGSIDSQWNQEHRPHDPLNFTAMAWHFLAGIHPR
jgi:poly(3-hydroxybutyrate) depolymerase